MCLSALAGFAYQTCSTVNMSRRTAEAITLLGVWLAFINMSEASVVNFPAGLQPGDHFRIVFVTPGGTLATSTDIDYYNDFVTNQATGYEYNGSAVSWYAIGSTSSVSARDNILGDTTAPVYLNDGTQIATSLTTSSGGLWSGSILNPIDKDLAGNGTHRIAVWTGTAFDGSAFADYELGAFNTINGLNPYTDHNWVAAWHAGAGLNSHLVYGISEVLVVPSSVVPEATSLAIWGLLGLTVGVIRRRT